MVELEASIRAFEPMATHARLLLFENVADNWPVLRERYPREALRRLAWAGRAAPKALTAEPHNWQVHHALARRYAAVAKTEPGYAVLAGRLRVSSLDVAPNLDPTLPLLERRRNRRRPARARARRPARMAHPTPETASPDSRPMSAWSFAL